MSISFFQALPVFLDNLVPDWGAILISVTLILFFGEVKVSLMYVPKTQVQ